MVLLNKYSGFFGFNNPIHFHSDGTNQVRRIQIAPKIRPWFIISHSVQSLRFNHVPSGTIQCRCLLNTTRSYMWVNIREDSIARADVWFRKKVTYTSWTWYHWLMNPVHCLSKECGIWPIRSEAKGVVGRRYRMNQAMETLSSQLICAFRNVSVITTCDAARLHVHPTEIDTSICP